MMTMPSLLPLLVRRSERSSTEAAIRPTLAVPARTARQKSAQDWTRSFSRIGPYSSSWWPERKKPMASHSRLSLSVWVQN